MLPNMYGMRVYMKVQEHNHPHILLLQIGNTFFKLPGGRLRPGENEVDGLNRKLTSKLAPSSSTIQPEWKYWLHRKTLWLRLHEDPKKVAKLLSLPYQPSVIQ
eukprot:Gb_09967 [translate_table: standard]